MGATLAKAAEYTSVAESGEKKLALVKTNEDIINKIITFVEQYPGECSNFVRAQQEYNIHAHVYGSFSKKIKFFSQFKIKEL